MAFLKANAICSFDQRKGLDEIAQLLSASRA